MSDLLKQQDIREAYCSIECGAIKHIIEPTEKDLGGFTVRRLLPVAKQKMVGPWIFFDHMGPAMFPPGQGISVRPHPHINLATVTYLFEGEMLHRDSLGSYQVITPGDINLMVAGKGITHSERQRDEIVNQDHVLNGLQLWLALPEAFEEIEPAFYHYAKDEIPELEVDGVPIRLMMGKAFGLESPVKTYANTLYIEANIPAGKPFTLPNAPERGLYVAKGQLKAKDTKLPEHSMTIFEPHDPIVIEAIEDSRVALIGGESLGKRYITWNFVSSRQERIEQAKHDWINGLFDKVVGDEEEFIPFPNS